MTMVGADAQQLRAAAGQLRRAAEDLDRQASTVGRLLHSVEWIGQVAERFGALFHRQEQIQLSTTGFIRDMADALVRQADQQEAASRDEVAYAQSRVASVLSASGRDRSAAAGSIATELARLTPGQRSEVILSMTVDQLAELRRQLQNPTVSQAERAAFFHQILPGLSLEAQTRILGSDASTIESSYGFVGADATRGAVEAALTSTKGVSEGQIEVRSLASGTYIVVLPGVTDLSGGFDRATDEAVAGLQQGGLAAVVSPVAGAARAARGLVSGAQSAWAEFDGPNQFDSPRDMHYGIPAALDSWQGSVNDTNAYAIAVKHAMQVAGVPDGADVMFVGHSFGAYTAVQMASDPSFNRSDTGGGGYSVNVTNVVAAGADTDWMNAHLVNGTDVAYFNNTNDRVYLAETGAHISDLWRDDDAPHEVTFEGGSSGFGHDPSNYVDAVRAGALDSYLTTLPGGYSGPGTAVRVGVHDPLR